METNNIQQNQSFVLPSAGSMGKFDSAAFLKQVKKVKKLLSPEELEMLKSNDRENKR